MPRATAISTFQASNLTAPTIELLNAYDEIDLEQLGTEPLVTYIHYDGIAEGDRVRIYWRGASALGEPLDEVDIELEVEQPAFDPARKRMRVAISNNFLVGADQGYAFYSYVRLGNGSVPEEGSRRTFCFVGVRKHRLEYLPVAQAVEAHSLFIDSTMLGSSGATFIVPPYQAMEAGDVVTLFFRGHESDGSFFDEWSLSQELKESNIGQSLAWTVPKSEFDWIQGGHADVHYTIAFAKQLATLQGPTQTYRIDPIPADPERLPPPAIVGHDGGPIDPSDFPDGLTVRLPLYTQLHASDWMLLHVNHQPAAVSIRADLSTLASGVLNLKIAPQALEGLTRLKLAYQTARIGLGYGSHELDLEVLLPRMLSRVQIRDAETESPEPYAWLDVLKATTGAFVSVPDPGLRQGERLELHWVGRSDAGTYVHRLAEGSAAPYEFNIPGTAVAANMDTANAPGAKRFPVFYRLVREDDQYVQSPDMELRITPLDQTNYKTIQCIEASGVTLSLAAVPDSGATLKLDRWPFMSVGQKVNVYFNGVKENGQSHGVLLRSALTSNAEVSDGFITVLLSKQILLEQAMGQDFDISVRLNFENHSVEDTWVDLPSLTLTLKM